MAKASQFLRLTDRNGNLVEGECFDRDHEKEIAVRGWSWAVADPTAPKMGVKDKPVAGATATAAAAVPKAATRDERESNTKTVPEAFVLSKATDRSTTRLMSALDIGEIFPVGLLMLEEQYEDSPLPFKLHIELRDVFIVDFQWDLSAEGAGISMNETWKLNYADVAFKYLWRGGNAGWIEKSFEMRADAKAEASSKSPPTKGELQSQRDEELKEALKRLNKK